MPAMATPVTPLEAGGEMFQRAKTPFMESRPASTRPTSVAMDVVDTDFEEESEFEEYSPKGSFETDDRRTSQTTLSSYDEAPTPRSSQSQQPFDAMIRPVEGPRGPHLFRSSQISAEFAFDSALQMSPLAPKQPPPRTGTAFSDETITPITRQRRLEQDYSLATALHQAINSPGSNSQDSGESVRSWSPQQVVDWMLSTGADASVIECFEHHDVDGVVLSDLQFEDLKELDIRSFGKRHQIWNAICDLRGDESRPSPQPTPFQDISRPCTTNNRRSPSRSRNNCDTPVDADGNPISPEQGKKRRGRKAHKQLDVITPAESVSIVAIEQLIPKPHKCAKGERCAKWRKQQRELQQLKDENGLGRFPISPGKGGRVFVHGDPGNAATAENIIPNVRMQPAVEDALRPTSEAVPSVVASSDLLGPGQLPEFSLHPDKLDRVDMRDPQDNVRQFLNFQHVQSPAPPVDDMVPPTPGGLFTSRRDPIMRSESVPPLFPEQHHQAYPSLYPPPPPTREQLRSLPKLDIPNRSATAGPHLGSAISTAIPTSATSICRSITASPTQTYRITSPTYRLGTPASEMDIPVTAQPTGPISRDASSSVPPNMHYNQPAHGIARSHSRADYWRRPSQGLPAVREGEIFSPVSAREGARPHMNSRSGSGDSKSTMSSIEAEKRAARDPAHHSPNTQHFGYGSDCTHAGWMKKRKTKLLRHEWQDAHFRLKGTNLAMYADSRLSSKTIDNIDVDDYAVACSTVASNSKLTAAMRALKIKEEVKKSDATAFAFQLVPAPKEGEQRRNAASGKTHHFAVKSKDERIDWMRELMLAKARQAKREGFDVEVNGVQA